MATAQYFLGSSLNSVVSLDLDSSWAAKSVDTALYYHDNINKARFQQKQVQEKEQKLLALYEEQARQGYQRVGPGGGKVRQLFQERRGQNHHSGWDKSYPLEPISDKQRDRGTSLNNLNNVWKQPVRRARSQVRREPNNDLPSSRSYEPLDQLVLKYSSPVFGDENDYLSRVNDLDSSRIFRKLPNIGGAPLSDSADKFKTYITTKHPPATMAPAKEQKSQGRITDVGSITKAMARMSPPSKKPEVKQLTTVVNSKVKTSISPPASGIKQRISYTNSSNNTVAKAPIRPSSDTQAVEPEKMYRGGTTSSRAVPANRAPPPTRSTPAPPPPRSSPAPRGPPTGGRSDLVACKTCGRNFAPDRIQAHNEICAKTARKKRKPFDTTKHRIMGTDMEPYVKNRRPTVPPPKSTNSKMLQSLTKSNWRKKHEEFIANIRAAKQAQAHVAKGGKLSDLPPPPPMDTSDLIPCPHCKRKFNDAAAARHIPKCATMLHNKPKPGPPPTKRGTTTNRRF